MVKQETGRLYKRTFADSAGTAGTVKKYNKRAYPKTQNGAAEINVRLE